jgi:hypothetical protein
VRPVSGEEKTTSGVSRRDVIRRGAIIGGAVWAVPVVQSLAAPAFAAGSPPQNCADWVWFFELTDKHGHVIRTVGPVKLGPGYSAACCRDVQAAYANAPDPISAIFLSYVAANSGSCLPPGTVPV